jgi:hypothetical protein
MPRKTSDSHGYRTPIAPAHIARDIVDDPEAALEQFRETVKSSIWIPGHARNDESLEVHSPRKFGFLRSRHAAWASALS